MFLFLVHMPKAIYITGNLLYCIQQLKTLQISTLRGKAKNYSENILLCEYTCKTCGKRECRNEKAIFFPMAFWQQYKNCHPYLIWNPNSKCNIEFWIMPYLATLLTCLVVGWQLYNCVETNNVYYPCLNLIIRSIFYVNLIDFDRRLLNIFASSRN